MSRLKKTRSRVGRITESSGNVFADMALPNSEQELIKAQLTLQIYSLLKDSGMTQVEIGKILGVPQPQVSLLLRNRSGNFSVGRLMEFLTALRQDVESTVRPTLGARARRKQIPRAKTALGNDNRAASQRYADGGGCSR